MLEFFVPILYLTKPTQATIMIENTIFNALFGEEKVDSALVMRDVVKRLLVGVEKLKPTPICPYVFHLYHHAETLKLEEKKAYKIGEAIVEHNVDSDPKSESTREEDSERESLSLEEIAALEALNKSSTSRLKHTPQTERKAPTAKDC